MGNPLFSNDGAADLDEDSLEFLSKDAIDDEIDRTVDGDEQVGGLGERMEHLAS